MKSRRNLFMPALMIVALLMAGPAVAYRCEKKCAWNDDAARFCMSSAALEQAMFEAQHGRAASLSDHSACMGVERSDAVYVDVSKVRVPKPAVMVLLALDQAVDKVPAVDRLFTHSGLDPPGFCANFGKAAVPPQHAPPRGMPFC